MAPNGAERGGHRAMAAILGVLHGSTGCTCVQQRQHGGMQRFQFNFL